MSIAASVLFMLVLVVAGTWLAAVMDRAAGAVAAGRPISDPWRGPIASASALLTRQRVTTERPDALNWLLAPAFYLALAAVGLSVVPIADGMTVTTIETGIVLWGACESLTVVVVFLHGWSANSPLALIGAYRYVAIGLPVMLISMFVLIAAALPAESLSVIAVVESQREVWNVVRQPLGLPLFILLGLSLTLRGPFDYADAADLAGGTSVEDSGPGRAAWQFARLAILVSFSAMAATAFLGGHLGPVLPGPVWLILKTAAVMALVIAAGHALPRLTPSRMMTLIWTVLLPLSFLDLILAGLVAL